MGEVARTADVSEVTVFNHFPTKEDLFFGGMQFFEEELIAAVRERTPGEQAISAFRRVVVDGTARLADEDDDEVIARAAAVIAASPALQSREVAIVARYTHVLADLLAEETGGGTGDVEPAAVAGALMGVQRALVAYVRARVLAGGRGASLAADARSQATRAFALLEGGLSDYAMKKTAARSRP